MALEKIKATSNVIETFTQQTEEKPVVVELTIDSLVPYRSHPFTLYEGERLDDMVESVTENGVLTPIIVQPIEDGQYEILAGHNRWNASKIAGKKTIPAIIKTGLTEEEAYVYVVETNVFQRGFDNLKLSEQAAVIAERTDSFREEKRNAIREEIQSISGDSPNRADVAVGEEYGMGSEMWGPVRRGKRLVVQLQETFREKLAPGFVEKLDAFDLAKNANLPIEPVMIYGDDLTHIVTEEGIAYLHKCRNMEERTAAIRGVAGFTEVGLKADPEQTVKLRELGIIKTAADLDIDVSKATRNMLAAKNVHDLVVWSKGLYNPPAKFRNW